MNEKTFVVPNILCGHCTSAIEEEIGELAGVTSVSAEIESRKVTVKWQDPASWSGINEMLEEIGYPPQQLIQLG